MKSDKGDKALESSVEYLYRPRSHSVNYWCARPLPANASLSDSLRKARKIVQHSVRPWILSLEYERKVHPRVCLWDYQSHQLLWSKSGAEVEKDASSAAPAVSSTKSSIYIKTRSSTLLDNGLSFKNEDFSRKIEADKLPSNTSVVDILAIKFFDPNATGCRTEYSKCKSEDVNVAVMTEGYVAIYACSTGRHFVIHTKDLKEGDKKSSSFTTLDILDNDRLIVGMSDGHVKVYNVRTKAVEQSVLLLGDVLVAHIAVLPPKMGEESSASANERPRIVVVDSSSTAWLYSLPLSDPPSRLGDGVMPGVQGVCYDRVNQTVCIQNNDHKVSVWDVSESNLRTTTTNNRASLTKTASSSRRNSVFFNKPVASTSASAKAISQLLVYKLDKGMPAHLSKMTGLAVCYNLLSAYWMCGYSHVLAIVQDKTTLNDNSESASTAAGQVDKASRLQLVEEIDVQALLTTFLIQQGHTLPADQFVKSALKIYDVYSQPEHMDIVLLATSYGAIVLKVDEQSGSHVIQHPSWPHTIVLHEQSLRLIQTQPSSSVSNPISRHNNPQLPSTSSVTSTHTHASELQDVTIKSTKIDHPHQHHTVHVSPSGKYICIHYPYTYAYTIYTSEGDTVYTSHASDFAFVGNEDVYVIKNPAHHIGQEVKKRSSVFGFGNNSNKSAHKVFRFSNMSIKQVIGTKVNTIQEQVTMVDKDNASITPVRIMQLYSGPLTLACYLHPSYKDIDKANEEMGMESKLAMLPYTYSQFFAVSAPSSTPPSALVAVSPVLARVVGLTWNSGYDMCATLTANQVVNVYSYGEQLSCIFSLQSWSLSTNLVMSWQHRLLSLSTYYTMDLLAWGKGSDEKEKGKREKSQYELLGNTRLDICLGVHHPVNVAYPNTSIFLHDGSIKTVSLQEVWNSDGVCRLLQRCDESVFGDARDVGDIVLEGF